MLRGQLEGSEILKTEGMAMVQFCVEDTAEELEIGVVYGEAGVGKTFAVEYALALQTLPVAHVTIDKCPTPRELTRVLLEAVTGVDHDRPRFELRRTLIDVLADEPRLLVIDEAQALGYEGVEHLRHIHDDQKTQFGLMLVGGPNCWQILQRYPQLRSRVFRRRELVPLTDGEVLEILPSYHPVYATADPELLLLGNELARGRFREWRNITKTVVRLMERHQIVEIDERIVLHAMELMGAQRDAA